MRIGICPGSFDPVTLGHLDIIQRATKIFQHVYVAVLENPSKDAAFSVAERVDMLHQVTKCLPNVTIESFAGLVVEYARAKGAVAIVRGLRAVTDFDYEFKMAAMNRNLAPEIETMFMMTSSEYLFISSSAVKEVASLHGDVSGWVSPSVAKQLYQRLREQKEES